MQTRRCCGKAKMTSLSLSLHGELSVLPHAAAAEKISWIYTHTKLITLTNHNRNKQRDEPIRIPSSYLRSLLKAWEKSAHKMRLVLVLVLIGWKMARGLEANHLGQQSRSPTHFRQSFKNCPINWQWALIWPKIWVSVYRFLWFFLVFYVYPRAALYNFLGHRIGTCRSLGTRFLTFNGS